MLSDGDPILIQDHDPSETCDPFWDLTDAWTSTQQGGMGSKTFSMMSGRARSNPVLIVSAQGICGVPNHGKTRIKPTVLKKLHGTLNPTRDKKRASEPVPVGALRQTAPPELTPAERVVWRATVRNMPKGVLFRADAEIVKAFCRVAVRVDELQRALNEARGRPDWGSAAEHRNLDRALLLLARLAGELGLSPAARPRLGVAMPQERPPDDPWRSLELPRSPLRAVDGRPGSG